MNRKEGIRKDESKMKTIDEHIDELEIAIDYLKDDYAIAGNSFERYRFLFYFYILLLYYSIIQRLLLTFKKFTFNSIKSGKQIGFNE